ncbi:hypothetical protein BSL78_05474 [Apostichopus japonicus]|uniref:Uncharacterized protein n=2 Tax=Stichopus japonicus TaxID=307972 RepID=A0A2G8LBC3_STIJA|nr:hypothetical protein BSL78_05474 [Apostichopus japonicus]
MTPLPEALSSHVQMKPIPTDGEVIRMDSLFPNVNYNLQIKLEEKNMDKERQRQPFIKDVQSVRTEGEKFTIQSEEHGGSFLVWDKNDIDTRISEVIFSGCCLDPVSGSPANGSLYLGKLPETENMKFEVKAKMKDGDSCVEYEVAKTVCDQRNRESFGFERDCVKTFSFLTALRPDVRRPLVNEVVIKKAVYKAYCQALGHKEVKADVFWVTVHDVDDKFLKPLREIHVDKPIKELTKGLYKSFIDLSKHETRETRERRETLEDCRQIYRVMQTLVDRHRDCPACSVIYSRLRHEWVCSGLKSELQ